MSCRDCIVGRSLTVESIIVLLFAFTQLKVIQTEVKSNVVNAPFKTTNEFKN